MRFDRLSKAQGAYILGEAIGHERTAAQNSQRARPAEITVARRTSSKELESSQLTLHCGFNYLPPLGDMTSHRWSPGWERMVRLKLGRRSHLDSFCFWKLDRDQLSTEVRQFCLALCNG